LLERYGAAVEHRVFPRRTRTLPSGRHARAKLVE